MKDEKKKGDLFDSLFDAIGDLLERIVWVAWKLIELIFSRLMRGIQKKYAQKDEFDIPLTPRCKEIAREHEKIQKKKGGEECQLADT
jgi:hypothetical protein